ncbi:homogentisate phytyltransferase 1, chloroplastic isoform X2 [Primulina huaijiensis]|uniref:homogentisate phytyltransferase 1, chloroplastic isoform X2 n=1 Tax=Primulina huaijiensis TaxID=1492673 RepID=UPI003CC78E5B
MEPLLVGSFQKASSPLPIPYLAELTSLHCSSNVATHSFKRKAFRNEGKSYTMPLRLQLQAQGRALIDEICFGGRIVKLNSSRSLDSRVKSASEQSFESEPSKNPWNSPQHALDAFYRFSRPHTVIGTALSIISVSLLAVEKLSDFSPLFFSGVLEAIVAALLMNIYIVGLNQISDIDIDKVNKPYLPLASGEYSVITGVMIVSSFAILSFWLGWMIRSYPLLWALSVSFVLGTAYSINMFVFGRPAVFAKPVIFATAFMSFFSVVIALFKDIPDIVGDKKYGIQSFTVRLGQEKVFWVCIFLLEIAYAVALLVGATSSCTWSKWTTVIGHTILGLLLWNRAKSTDLKNKVAITSFYMFIWKLFYAEYLLIPLVR